MQVYQKVFAGFVFNMLKYFIFCTWLFQSRVPLKSNPVLCPSDVKKMCRLLTLRTQWTYSWSFKLLETELSKSLHFHILYTVSGGWIKRARMNPGIVNCKTAFSNSYRFATSCMSIDQYYLAFWRPPLFFFSCSPPHLLIPMFLRVKKNHELRGHLLFSVTFTAEGFGLTNAQQTQYAMLVSILHLGTCC